MSKIDKYYTGGENPSFNYLDKDRNIKNSINYMLNRSSTMFKYKNLPDTIPEKELELLLQCNGFGVFVKIGEDYYVVNGGVGGETDVYNNPTKAVIQIPYLKYNKELKIDTECIIISNDTLKMGLLPMYREYCYILNENKITMILANINKRIQTLISASDDNTVNSAKIFLKNIEDGKLGVIAEEKLFKSLSVNNSSVNSSISMTDLFEFHQYIKASLYNEIGLSANFNMKRERLTSAEVETNTDNLYPLVDDMLECRRLALEKINELFNLDIQVEFNSSWDYRILQGESIDTLDGEEPPQETNEPTGENAEPKDEPTNEPTGEPQEEDEEK